MSVKSLAGLAGLFLLSMLSVLATAQQPPTVHTHTNPDIIDGAKNPELIPDLTAWRLWLLSVTAKDPQHPELDAARQDAYLLAAGFEPEDLPTMRQALYDFKTAYDTTVQNHNQSAAALKTGRDLLVKEAQSRMLSVKVETEARVRGFISQQKRQMRVSKTEVQ